MVEVTDLKYAFNTKELSYVVNCLVIELDNTIQVVKNRGGNLAFDEVKDFDFIKVEKDDIDFCDHIHEMFYGKNVWFIGTEENDTLNDYDVKINDIKRKSEHLNHILKELENKRDRKWFEETATQIGIEAAIYEWCKLNDKYYSKPLLDASVVESVRINTYKNLQMNSLQCYKKNLSLRQYRDLKFKDTFKGIK